MDEKLYHVVQGEQKLGPYDARTIVGMRVKKTLANDSVLIRPDGQRMTVEELVRAQRSAAHPDASGSHAPLAGKFEAEITQCGRAGPLPHYRGAVEVRARADVLRIAGQLRGKDDRVKIPLADVAHARARESFVDLWLRAPGGKLQAATLRMMSPEVAKELVACLPGSSPPPPELALPPIRLPYGLVIGVSATVIVIVGVVLLLVL